MNGRRRGAARVLEVVMKSAAVLALFVVRKTLCAGGAWHALLDGPSTSPLAVT